MVAKLRRSSWSTPRRRSWALIAAMFASVSQGRESVTEVCARLQISRQTYYKYLRRFAAEGLDGLRERSRRPDSSPTKTPQAVVEVIVSTCALLENEGWDFGALSIHNRMVRDGRTPVPSWRTIHRILVAEQLVAVQPQKRPRSARRPSPRPGRPVGPNPEAWNRPPGGRRPPNSAGGPAAGRG